MSDLGVQDPDNTLSPEELKAFEVVVDEGEIGDKKHTVVIPAHFEHKIADVINSVRKGVADTAGLEVIIVINGENDDSERKRTLPTIKSYLQNNHIDFNLVVLSSKLAGTWKARNAGAERATGERLWFIDADTFVPEGFFDRGHAHCTRNGIDIASAYSVPVNRQGAEMKLAAETFEEKCHAKLHQAFQWISQVISTRYFARPIAAGACITMLSETFRDQTDGFPDLKVGEDLMFAKKCVEDGMKFGILPKSVGEILVDARRFLRAKAQGEEELKRFLSAFGSALKDYLVTGKAPDPAKYDYDYDYGRFQEY